MSVKVVSHALQSDGIVSSTSDVQEATGDGSVWIHMGKSTCKMQNLHDCEYVYPVRVDVYDGEIVVLADVAR